MNHRKKLLGKMGNLALCLCMFLSCLPAPAYAVTEDGLCDQHQVHTEKYSDIEGESTCDECIREQPEEPDAAPVEEPTPISDDGGTLTEETAAVKVVSGDTTTYYASFDECLADMDGSRTITILQDTTHDSDLQLGCKELIVNAGATLTLNTELYVIINALGNTPISGSGTIAGNGTLSAAGDISDVTISCPVKLSPGAVGSIKSGTFTNTVTISVGGFNIQGGTFSGAVTVDAGQITGGDFYGTVTNNSQGPNMFSNGGIAGGEFHCSVINNSSVTGGNFYGAVTSSSQLHGGTFYDTVDSTGSVYGGTYNGTVTIHSYDELLARSMLCGGTFNGNLRIYGLVMEDNSGAIILGENCTVTNYSTATSSSCSHTYRNASGICRLCCDGCTHNSWTGGICDGCGRVCEHTYENGICTICGDYDPPTLTDGYYQIGSAPELLWFARQVNQGDTAIHGILTADINLAGVDWTPIGTSGKPYSGTFHGNGKTISGLSITATGNNQGLFGVVNGGTVKNFIVTGDINISATVENVSGAVASATNGATIEEVTSYVTISDIRTGVDTTDEKSSRINHVGGVVGSLDSSTLKKSKNYGSITMQIGGAVGGVAGIAGTSSTISRCENHGTVTSNGKSAHVAGIGGDVQVGTTVTCCLNFGNVTSGGNDCVGGVVGYANQNVKIENCGNSGSVKSTFETGGFVGGILGYINNNSFGSLKNCFNTGMITSNRGEDCHIGAIVGWQRSNGVSMISNNYYLDTSCAQASGGNAINDAKAETQSAFKTGEVAYKLNGENGDGSWKQTIETDSLPNFDGKQVYYGFASCAEDKEAGYTNDSNVSSTRKAHTFVNGKCSVCNALEIHELSIANGTITLSEENGTTYYQQGSGEKTAYTGTLKIAGTTAENTINVENGTHTVMFDSLSIAIQNQIPLTLNSGTVNLTLTGENVLGSRGYEAQSILLASGTILTITAASTGTLYLTNGISDQNNYTGSPFTAYTRDLIDGGGSLCINGGTVGLQPRESDDMPYMTGGGIGIQGDLTVSGGSLTVGFIAAKNVKISGGAVTIKGLKGLNRIYQEQMVDPNAPCTTHGIFASNEIVISGGAVDVLTEGPACSDVSVYATKKVNQSHGLYAMNAVTISGGTVKASVSCYDYHIDSFGSWNMKAVDDANNDWGYGIYSGTITITGGNVKVSGKEATNVTPTNGKTSVYENILTLQGVTSPVCITALQGISGYGLNDVTTLDTNKLYLYLSDGANITEVTAGGGTYTGTLTDRSGTYTYVGAAVASVSITWGAMNFTYSDGTWNTQTHTYDGAGWTAEGNTVTVENTGNVAVTATVSYQNETGYSFTASWDKETANIPAAKKETFTLTLSGKPTAALDKKKVGTVTVTIQ